MEIPLLSDEKVFPSEEIIFSCIGKTKVLWQSVFEYIHSSYPDFSENWNYYNDGKRWLLKVISKKKTVFWLAVLQDKFRMTFYFPDKAEQAILNSNVPDEIKDQFQNKIGKTHGISIIFTNKKDIEFAKCLMAIKLNIK